jgi:hypothetical protein
MERFQNLFQWFTGLGFLDIYYFAVCSHGRITYWHRVLGFGMVKDHFIFQLKYLSLYPIDILIYSRANAESSFYMNGTTNATDSQGLSLLFQQRVFYMKIFSGQF